MKRYKLLLVLVLAGLLLAFFAFDLGHLLSLDALRQSLTRIEQWRASSPLTLAAAFFSVYLLVAALSLPGGAVTLTLAAGAIFGLGWGTVLASFASSLGAALAFLAARFVLRDWVRSRFSQRLQEIDRGLERDGAFYLFALRLVPLVPFFIINPVMGLTRMSLPRFYAVSQLGMLAGTLVYVNAGTQLASIRSARDVFSSALLASFVLLAALPLIARRGVDLLRRRRVYAPWRAVKPRRFDRNLVVIGAGAGGLVSAYIAAAVKAKVTLIEVGAMGGDCLNQGCVPSKALIRSARLAHEVRQAQAFGLGQQPPVVNFPAVMQRVAAVIDAIAPHDSEQRYQGLGVEVLRGHARIVHPWGVEVTDASGVCQTLTTRSIVVATGARPTVPDLPGLDAVGYLTSETLWAAWARLDHIPARVLILGGGAVGCELAQACARLGAAVMLVEQGARLLAREDRDVSALVQSALAADSVKVHLEHRALRCEWNAGEKTLIAEYAGALHTLPFDALICAVGRSARLHGFGLEELGLGGARTLVTNEFMQTKFPNILAAGDVVGPVQLTHVAAHQAWYASVNALLAPWHRFRVDMRAVPRTTFVDPEVAAVGLNEQDATAQGIAFELTRFELADLDRAIADGATSGFVKVLTRPGSDRILGVTIAGSQAGELLAEYVLAMNNGLGLNRILASIHSYPTLAEANKYAAGQWKRTHAPQRLLAWLERYHAWMRQ